MDGERGVYDPETGEVVDRPQLPARTPSQGERNLIFASPDCGEVFGALAEAQGKMGNPKKTKSAKVQGTTKGGASYNYDYKYAPLEEVVDVIRGPMSQAGLVYRQFLAQRGDAWMMRTIIAHRSGQWFGCDYPVFADRPGAQGFASGVTYSRRYGLMLALGLVGEDDDDANVADGNVAKIDGGARTAQESAPAATTGRGRPQAAPAPSEAKAEATRRWKELRDEIDACMTIPAPNGLDGIAGSLAWTACVGAVSAAGDAADNVMGLLLDRIEKRRAMLLEPEGGY